LSLTIVIPVFNEEECIEATLLHLAALAAEHEYAIVVVDDGSTDRTPVILDGLATRLPMLRVVTHDFNSGYGAALKTALRAAVTEYIAITDADGTYPNEVIPDLAKRCQNRDMVVGARTGPGVVYSRVRALPKVFLKRWVSWIAGRKVPDINSGLRVFRRDVAESFFGIYPDGFSFTITITLAMLTTHRQVDFVPISYASRVGISKIRPIRDTVRFINIILRTGVYFAPIRAFSPVVILLTFGGLASLSSDIYQRDLTEATLLLFLFALNTGMFMLLADMIEKRTTL
jgi:glycosyltransferase involved in cell wall biosynthesis